MAHAPEEDTHIEAEPALRRHMLPGAAALLLTWGVYYGNAKYLGTNDVKYILIRGAVRDESVTSSGSEEFPNNIWGYGRLNLINSFLELRVT